MLSETDKHIQYNNNSFNQLLLISNKKQFLHFEPVDISTFPCLVQIQMLVLYYSQYESLTAKTESQGTNCPYISNILTFTIISFIFWTFPFLAQIFNIFQHLFRTKMTMYSTKPEILSVAWLMIPWLILYLWDQSTYRFSASYLLQCIMQDAWCITIYHLTTLVYHFTTLVGLIFMKTNIPKFSLPPHKSKSSPRNLRWT